MPLQSMCHTGQCTYCTLTDEKKKTEFYNKNNGKLSNFHSEDYFYLNTDSSALFQEEPIL